MLRGGKEDTGPGPRRDRAVQMVGNNGRGLARLHSLAGSCSSSRFST